MIFSANLSLLTVVWGIVSQIDKLMLSTTLTLEEFGYYSLAVSAASLIMVLSAPLSQYLMPRFTTLIANKRRDEYLSLYVKSYAVLSITLITLGLFMFVFSSQILEIWTGNVAVSGLPSVPAGNPFAPIA